MFKKMMFSVLGFFTITGVTKAQVPNHSSNENKDFGKLQVLETDLAKNLEIKLETLSRDELILIIKESALKSQKTDLILNNNHGINISDIRSRFGSHEHGKGN